MQFRFSQRLILIWVILAMFCFVGFSNVSAQAPAAASPAKQAITGTASTQYLAKINALRTQKNLHALHIMPELEQSAHNKATAMVGQHYWGHYAPDGVSFKDYIWQSVPKADYVGENLARCFNSRDNAFTALVASPTHYEIMVGNFEYVGASEVTDPQLGCTITVFHFAQM